MDSSKFACSRKARIEALESGRLIDISREARKYTLPIPSFITPRLNQRLADVAGRRRFRFLIEQFELWLIVALCGPPVDKIQCQLLGEHSVMYIGSDPEADDCVLVFDIASSTAPNGRRPAIQI